MAYATKQDMIDRYGEEKLIELTDRAEPPAGEIDDDILDAALEDASGVIDGFVARRYKLPIAAPAPVILKRHCMTIAWFDLHRGRYTEEDKEAYSLAHQNLLDISRGNIVLDVGGAQPPSAAAEAVEESSERIFNRDSLKGL